MTESSAGLSAGLCSVTLRQEPVDRVARLAGSAGLVCIEWGADVHVPPGDPAATARAREWGLEHGLRVASYGSYFAAGVHPADEFVDVLAAAVALRAPRIRIWAGSEGSATATADQRRAVIRATRDAAKRAGDVGLEVAYEFHGGTLTDTPDATVRLLEEVDAGNVGSYWQPPVGTPDDEALAGLEIVLPWLSAVHVFSWWPGRQRLPLREREELWRRVFAVLRKTSRAYDTLLEFVPQDDPAQLERDARTLLALIEGGTSQS